MEKNEILKKINDSFAKILEHDNFKLVDETTAHDVDGWDSVSHLMIITEIEEKFEIEFELMELMNMNTIGDLISSISNKIS
ncbi:phosphopantetheine-binding protein [Yeosuana marina]|uniref:phosphopantetheine-binding protein n=1 Tax=Yeosuana marina TaxID=1565536 RepID=UPI0030EE3EF4|tara:strand:+ start:67 stop:309 length:243 start_codon:yes stop_codon:yes gene_type:complete